MKSLFIAFLFCFLTAPAFAEMPAILADLSASDAGIVELNNDVTSKLTGTGSYTEYRYGFIGMNYNDASQRLNTRYWRLDATYTGPTLGISQVAKIRIYTGDPEREFNTRDIVLLSNTMADKSVYTAKWGYTNKGIMPGKF